MHSVNRLNEPWTDNSNRSFRRRQCIRLQPYTVVEETTSYCFSLFVSVIKWDRQTIGKLSALLSLSPLSLSVSPSLCVFLHLSRLSVSLSVYSSHSDSPYLYVFLCISTFLSLTVSLCISLSLSLSLFCLSVCLSLSLCCRIFFDLRSFVG